MVESMTGRNRDIAGTVMGMLLALGVVVFATSNSTGRRRGPGWAGGDSRDGRGGRDDGPHRAGGSVGARAPSTVTP